MPPQAGDKVRIKAKGSTASRGVIMRIEGKKLVIQPEDSEELVVLTEAEVTNFSFAARKAWESSPDRAVGRKKKTTPSDRVSVTLRIDRELWEAFQEREAAGEIDDRTATINEWFREKLAELNCVEQ